MQIEVLNLRTGWKEVHRSPGLIQLSEGVICYAGTDNGFLIDAASQSNLVVRKRRTRGGRYLQVDTRQYQTGEGGFQTVLSVHQVLYVGLLRLSVRG